jgi:hypothetical protein
MTEEINEDDLWCEYSDMPSPLAYIKNEGYGGEGSHVKFLKKEKDEKNDSKDCVMVITQVPKER